MIAYTLYLTVVNNMQSLELENKTIRFTIFSYGLPLILSLILLFTGKLGKTDFSQCWVKYEQNENGQNVINSNLIWGTLTFYLPIAILLIFNIVMLSIVIRKLGNIFSSMNNQVINRLKLYPMILIFCWTIGCIYRITLAIGIKDHITPKLIHTILSGLNGFFNFLAYGMQNQV